MRNWSLLSQAISALQQQGLPCVIATVVATKGSTPQKVGWKLIVSPQGRVAGTIGGGRVEAKIIEDALTLFHNVLAPTLKEYHLTQELGMCCGGTMTVYLETMVAQERLWIFGA